MIYKFAEFKLDTSQNKLFKDDQIVKLGDKSFKLLTLLVSQSPNTVSKQEVMEEVWKGRVVTESTLYKTISRIRQELVGAGLSIESVFSEGYRISGVVEQSDTDQNETLEQAAKSKLVFNPTSLWLILLLIVITSLSYYSINKKPTMTLNHAIAEMRNAMSINKKAFLSQINQRNELGKMLASRFDIDPKLSWERKFFIYYDQMNAQELFVFAQIRAYTDGPMLTNNQILLDLINNNKQIITEIAESDTLRNHLIIWINKYHKIFKDSKKMCLLYVGVEDGAPYPTPVDQQVLDWLASHRNDSNEKSNKLIN